MFWAALNQRVYAKNWSAKNRDQLIKKIKKSVKEMESEVYVNLFEKLPPRINLANENGLDSLL